MPYKKGQSGNPAGRTKCKYDLNALKGSILDKFGGVGGFVDHWYGKDKRYLSDWLKEFVKKEVKFEGKLDGRIIVELIDQFNVKDKDAKPK